MKKMTRTILLSSLFSLVAMQAYAGTCEIKYTRTACPGQEKVSYKKCNGAASCSEFEDAASASDCAALATAACENKRLDITKSKVINATFDDKPVKGASGSDDLCTDYKNKAAEFNKCS
jgi:hypothetical protein